MGKIGQKKFFLEFNGKCSHFFGIWSVKKNNLICCILAKNHTWGKSGSCDMGQNTYSQTARFLN